MLDKNILDTDVFKNKKIKIKISKPFNNLAMDFIADFSKELRKYPFSGSLLRIKTNMKGKRTISFKNHIHQPNYKSGLRTG